MRNELDCCFVHVPSSVIVFGVDLLESGILEPYCEGQTQVRGESRVTHNTVEKKERLGQAYLLELENVRTIYRLQYRFSVAGGTFATARSYTSRTLVGWTSSPSSLSAR